MTIRTTLVISIGLATGVTAAPLTAQLLPRDSAVVVATADTFGSTVGQGGGVWLVSADRQQFTPIANASGPMEPFRWANCVTVDPRTGIVFVGTLSRDANGGGNIYALRIASGQAVASRVTTQTPLQGGSVSGLTIRGDDLWFVADRDVGSVPLHTGGVATLHVNTSAFPGIPQSIATNGREVFVGMSSASGQVYNVLGYDPDGQNPALYGVALTPVVAFANSLGQMNMVDGETLFASDFGGFGMLIDTLTGTVQQLNQLRAPRLSAHAGILNPCTRTYFAGPGFSPTTPREIHAYDDSTAQWTVTPIGVAGPPGFPTGIASMHHRPFTHFGVGCAGANQLEARVAACGLSSIGNANFQIALRNAEANQTTTALFGVSRTVSGGMSLPLDLGPFGAPGCWLLVSSEVTAGQTTDQNGDASLTVAVPNDPALAHTGLFVQWAVLTGANALGVVTSDAAAIVLR